MYQMTTFEEEMDRESKKETVLTSKSLRMLNTLFSPKWEQRIQKLVHSSSKLPSKLREVLLLRITCKIYNNPRSFTLEALKVGFSHKASLAVTKLVQAQKSEV